MTTYINALRTELMILKLLKEHHVDIRLRLKLLKDKVIKAKYNYFIKLGFKKLSQRRKNEILISNNTRTIYRYSRIKRG